MHITHLPWCDFVVWSPTQEPFVQRVLYDAGFMTTALRKARNFYFDKFLPSVISSIMVSPTVPGVNGHHVSCSFTNTTNSETKISMKVTVYTTLASTSNSKDAAGNFIHPNQASISSTPVTISSTPVTIPSTTVSVSSTQMRISSTQLPTYIKKEIATNNALCPATSADLEATGSHICKSFPFNAVLKELSVKCHLVNGDGSCLYHAVAHQAGFISKNSRGGITISSQLRQLALNMMKHPAVQVEDGLTVAWWLQKKVTILQLSEWGGDLELQLLAIGIQRDIVVVTSDSFDSCYARRFPCQSPPSPKMKGGIFIPLTSNELCEQWNSMSPTPLLLIYNGQNHYNSALPL